MLPRLFIIVPCYNEEEVLPLTAPVFLKKITALTEKGKIAGNSRVLFVNDGSRDRTWQIITELAGKDDHFLGMSQSRNRGHQNAVLAGLMEVKDACDITVTIDADGQDDINAIDAMVDAYLDGCGFSLSGIHKSQLNTLRRIETVVERADLDRLRFIGKIAESQLQMSTVRRDGCKAADLQPITTGIAKQQA